MNPNVKLAIPAIAVLAVVISLVLKPSSAPVATIQATPEATATPATPVPTATPTKTPELKSAFLRTITDDMGMIRYVTDTKPSIGTKPIIGMSKEAVFAELESHGWGYKPPIGNPNLKPDPSKWRYEMRFYNTDAGKMDIVVSLNKANTAVGVSYVCAEGRRGSAFVDVHKNALTKWACGSKKYPVRITKDDSGDQDLPDIAIFDVGTATDPETGEPIS